MVKRTFSNTCTQILEWLWETMYLHDIVLLYFSYLYLFLLQLCISAYGERSWLLLFLTVCVTLSKRKSLTEKCGVLSEVTKQVSPPRDNPTPDQAVQLCSGNGRWAGRSQSTCSWSWKGSSPARSHTAASWPGGSSVTAVVTCWNRPAQWTRM